MTAPRISPAMQSVQRLTSLTQRREELAQRLFRAQAAHEQSKSALEAARATALEDFGTSNVAELRQQYAAVNEENQSKLRKFDEDLTNVEQSLADINSRVGAEQPGA